MNTTTDPSARPKLIRALGPLMATAIVVGTVIGSGIFKKPQTVADVVPYAGLAALVWVMGGVLALLGALTIAEVSVLYPRAGGCYVYLREGYGRMAGFLWGWVEFWMIRGGSVAALATIFSESLGDVLANPAFQKLTGLDLGPKPLDYWSQRLLTVSVIMGLALVNIRGVRWGGMLQLIITLVKVASLLAIAALPFVAYRLASPGEAVPEPQVEYLRPLWPDDWTMIPWGGVGTAMLAVLWAYHGWLNLAPIGAEVRDPQRNLPLALLAGICTIIFLYLSANLAYYLIVPREEMAGIKDTTVATVFSLRLLGPIGAAAAAAAVMCSVFGALNGNLLVGPRLLYAMGEDGLAPRALSAIHPRFHTPALSIFIMGLWASTLVLGVSMLTKSGVLPEGKSLFDTITDFAMFGAVIFETASVATVFVFRYRYPDVPRPYRCIGYPVVPIVYIIILSLVATNMFVHQTAEAMAGVSFMVVGAMVYLVWLRNIPPQQAPIPIGEA